jgi:hypothetical protein
MMPCQRTRVCPFCYARNIVLEAYKSLEFALFHTIGDRELAEFTRAWDEERALLNARYGLSLF